MVRSIAALLLVSLLCAAAQAESVGTPADHDALRKLKADAMVAVNNRDYATMKKFLHEPFMATLITQDSFNDFGKLKSYFEGLYTRDQRRLTKVTLAAESDELSQIYQGTFAVNKGSTKEHYELADGRSFDIDGRWTSVSVKDGAEWKLLAIHTGANFLDNPVMHAVEKSVLWIGAIGAGVGLLVGFIAGRLFRRSAAGK